MNHQFKNQEKVGYKMHFFVFVRFLYVEKIRKKFNEL
jgi:hypothetical protein